MGIYQNITAIDDIENIIVFPVSSSTGDFEGSICFWSYSSENFKYPYMQIVGGDTTVSDKASDGSYISIDSNNRQITIYPISGYFQGSLQYIYLICSR